MFLGQGDDGRPILNTTVEEIAHLCLKEMRTVQPEGPYYLAGFSFGGLVVYEMAQQLCNQGETIGLLALVDPTTPLSKSAPTTHRFQLRSVLRRTTHHRNRWLSNLSNFVSIFFRKALNAVRWIMGSLKNTLQHAFMFEFRKMACTMFFIFNYPLPTSLRKFYRDNVFIKSARQYSPQNYPGQIVIFQTNNFVENYWCKLCAEVVQVYELPCKHIDILVDGPHVSTFLPHFMDCLEKAQKKHG